MTYSWTNVTFTAAVHANYLKVAIMEFLVLHVHAVERADL